MLFWYCFKFILFFLSPQEQSGWSFYFGSGSGTLLFTKMVRMTCIIFNCSGSCRVYTGMASPLFLSTWPFLCGAIQVIASSLNMYSYPSRKYLNQRQHGVTFLPLNRLILLQIHRENIFHGVTFLPLNWLVLLLENIGTGDKFFIASPSSPFNWLILLLVNIQVMASPLSLSTG